MSNTIKDLKEDKISEFTAKLRGRAIFPSDKDYRETCKVYNGMIKKHPGLFVMCVDVADVIASVNFARENDILLAIRGGGHNGGGLGLCNEGLVIDLSGIKFVRVDTSDNTVRVGGGNLWGEVDHATHPFGLAIPAGIVSSTGVGGLTLGGGVG
ncbi:MAG: FAD-dependent oxidoreductase, partial [Muriicola sp.]|nr:FAD-dependent oxidoreductase [Muriicola sp.]